MPTAADTERVSKMKWKDEAIEKLKRYDAMHAAQQNIAREIARLKEEAFAIRRADPEATPVRGSGGRYDEQLMNNIVKRQELAWTLKQVKLWITNTDRGLTALNDEERQVLQRMYLYPQKGAVDKLCEELGMEQSTVYRKRDQALEHFTIAMYGFSET